MDLANAGEDVVVEWYGKPTVAVIPYADYVELLDALDDLRSAQQARIALEGWRHDPNTARPWSEVEDSVLRAFMEAPEDDEPLTAEEEAAIQEARGRRLR